MIHDIKPNQTKPNLTTQLHSTPPKKNGNMNVHLMQLSNI